MASMIGLDSEMRCSRRRMDSALDRRPRCCGLPPAAPPPPEAARRWLRTILKVSVFPDPDSPLITTAWALPSLRTREGERARGGDRQSKEIKRARGRYRAKRERVRERERTKCVVNSY